jgi:hypothetical protein
MASGLHYQNRRGYLELEEKVSYETENSIQIRFP